MSTNNAVNTNLSGQTGTGSFVGSVSPTINQLTFSPSTGGIVGTTTNNNANTGYVGEFVTSNIPFASAVPVVVGPPINVTSILLPSGGDWEIFGNVFCAILTGGGTSISAWTSITSATLPNLSLISSVSLIVPNSILTNAGLITPYLRVSTASSITVYLSASVDHTGTANASGTISARGVR